MNKDLQTNTTAIDANTLLPTVFVSPMLPKLHNIIDKKFNRKDRSKLISPVLLKAKMTLWSLSEEFLNEDPNEIVLQLKELVKTGSVISNIDEDDVYPFDAYFIPKTEMMNEEHFKIFASVVKTLHCW